MFTAGPIEIATALRLGMLACRRRRYRLRFFPAALIEAFKARALLSIPEPARVMSAWGFALARLPQHGRAGRYSRLRRRVHRSRYGVSPYRMSEDGVPQSRALVADEEPSGRRGLPRGLPQVPARPPGHGPGWPGLISAACGASASDGLITTGGNAKVGTLNAFRPIKSSTAGN